MHHGVGSFVAICLLFGGIFHYAQVFSYKTPEVVPIVTPALVSTLTESTVSAEAYVVFDMNTGQVIASLKPDDVLPIASVAKLFTAAAVLSVHELAATTTVSESDVATEGRSGKLSVGDEYTYHELLFPLLLESSNDAATALTTPRILAVMREMAEASEATKTVFADTAGLSDNTVSTAHDLQKMLVGVYRTAPHIFDITTLPQYIGVETGLKNNNPLHSLPGYRGGKNGYTEAANRTVVAVFDEEVRGRQYTVGYILLGSDNLVADVGVLRSSLE